MAAPVRILDHRERPIVSNMETPASEHRNAIRLLSVTFPVYNEEAAIAQVVLEHAAVLARLGTVVLEWELVCVDDGSKDRTPEILRDLQSRVPQLRVIHQENRGIFGAFTRAYQEARGSHIFMTGSDGQWPAENLEMLLPELLAGADVVVGVRTNRPEVYTVARRVISDLFNRLPLLLLGVRVEDAGSTKLGIREVFDYRLISTSSCFEAERLILAHRKGKRIAFVPIRFQPRSGGKATGASFKNIYLSAMDLLRCLAAYGFR